MDAVLAEAQRARMRSANPEEVPLPLGGALDTEPVLRGFSEAQARNRHALVIFAVLQGLDFLTTMAVFAKGGYEGNPLVRSLIPIAGPAGAVLLSKVALVALTWKLSRRPWIIWTGNALYGLIVIWNALLAFLPIT